MSGTTLIVSPHQSPSRARTCEPITVGVPLPRGVVRDPHRIGLVGHGQVMVPIQALPTEHWPDGSIRWALLDFQAIGPAASDRRYQLKLDGDGAARPAPCVEINETAERIEVDTGAARFRLQAGAAFPFAAVIAGGLAPIDASSSAFVVIDAKGKSWRARVVKVEVEERGPIRSSIRLDAVVGPRRRPLLQVIARVHFFAGSAATRIAVTVRNPRKARHKGGAWELGDRGSVYVRDASLHLALPSGITALDCAPELGLVSQRSSVPFELYQDSSGGEHWRHPTHVNRHDEVPCTFRGYRLRAGDALHHGLRATPSVTATHASGSVLVAVEHFWQNFPKAIEADGRRLTLRLWPRQFADAHEIQGGEQKTHAFTLAFGSDPMARDAAFWGRAPSTAAATPEWYAATEAIPYLAPAGEDVDRRYRVLVDAAIAGEEAFERKRETIDEYGWQKLRRHLRRSRESRSAERPSRSSRTTTTSTTRSYGFAAQFMRTGDARWWRLMTELAVARHRHRHLSHRSRQGGLQQRSVLAHVPLRGRRQVQPPVVSAPRQRLRRRAGQRAQLRRRPAAALAADRRSLVARGGDWPGGVGHQHGRRPQDHPAVAGALGHRPGQRDTVARLSRSRARGGAFDHGAARRPSSHG